MSRFGKIQSGDQILPARLTRDGYQCVVPAFVGGSDVPTSPIIKDTMGSTLYDYRIEHDGVTKISIWRSKNSPDPANAVSGVVPDGEASDHSNLKWKFVEEVTLTYGQEELSARILQEVSKSRYVKIDVERGAPITIAHNYGI